MANQTIEIPVSVFDKLTKAALAWSEFYEALQAFLKKNDDQSWYWTERWQKAEREADEDIKAGRVKAFDNVEDLIRELNS